MEKDNIIEIKYCTQCNWIFRASWMAQELLTTFNTELKSVILSPVSGGRYEILVNNREVYSLKESRKFLQPKELKKLVRDEISPNKDLGHSDTK